MTDDANPPQDSPDVVPSRDLPETAPPLRGRPRRWPLGALTLIAAVVVGAGVMLFGDNSTSPSVTTAPTLGNFGVPTGVAAPDFAIDRLDGIRFVLSDELAAGRPVILNLWASWCTPCREEMPEIDAAAAANPDISFIGVAVQDDPDDAAEFADEIAVSYPLAVDELGAVGRLYPSPGLPTTFLISTDGRILRVLFGGLSEEQVSAAIAEVFGL